MSTTPALNPGEATSWAAARESFPTVSTNVTDSKWRDSSASKKTARRLW